MREALGLEEALETSRAHTHGTQLPTQCIIAAYKCRRGGWGRHHADTAVAAWALVHAQDGHTVGAHHAATATTTTTSTATAAWHPRRVCELVHAHPTLVAT